MRKIYSLIFVIISLQGFAQQDTLRVTKDQLVDLVQNNMQIAIDNSEIAVAEADLLQSRALYLPNVTLSYTGTTTNNPLMAFGSKLNQAVVTQSDFNPDLLNNPDNILNFETKLEVQQPIYNRHGVWQKKAGEVKVNALQLKSERTKEYLEMEISKAYMQLQLAHKAVKVLEEAKQTTLANKKLIDNYYNNGMIQKSEVLYVDVRLNEVESDLFAAKSNVQNASDYISYLSNQEMGSVIYQPTDELVYDTSFGEMDPNLNSERSDLQAQAKALEAYDMMIKSSKAKFLPSVNAFGNFALYDESPVGFGANGYLVGVMASWNIFDGKKADSEQQKFLAEKDKAETELQNYEKQSQLELNKAMRDILDANKKVELTKLAWEQTEEAYRIRKNRFEQGLEKSADLLTAETKMSQKELEFQQAVFEYNAALEYFKYLKK